MDDLRDQLQRTLGSAYTIERELGGGGMSRVFVATETRLGRRVVVKVLRAEIAAGTSAERFEREMALCARCHHPHIVPVLSAGEVGGMPWFTMPLVEGESLRDRLSQGGPVPIAEAVRLLAETADGLAYAHRMGIVHRDIKPENILLQDGHALVADFGVAKAVHAATLTDATSPTQMTGVGTIIGTPAYMAPEQAAGEAIDHRVDLYALGVVAHELLTGKNPFAGATPAQMIGAHFTLTPPSVAEVRRDCPPALASLIQRLLAKDPAARPASADDVRAELQAIAGGALEGSVPGHQRSTAIAAALGAVAVLAALYVALTRGRPVATSAPPAAVAPEGKSLAVLRFQNIGGDSTTDYFSAGISEELISALGRLKGLRVASRTSAFAAGAGGASLREIGARLGVAVVVEGTFQLIAERVRVTARLVEVARDSQLWSGQYRTEIRDVFAVQDTIARAIASALQVTLLGGSGGALIERGTSDSAAYDLYLRGRYFLAMRGPGALRKAADAFEKAVRQDSSYAAAWAGVADANYLGVIFAGFPHRISMPAARAAAHRALALDSTIAEPHTSLGFIAMMLDWDWAEAERQMDRAVELNPSYVQARLYRSWLYVLTGRTEESLAEIERARALDPLSLIIRTRIGTMLHFAGRDREAIGAYLHALEIDSTFAHARAGLALSYAMTGRFQEALAIKPDVVPMLANYESSQWAVVQVLAGRPAEARRMLAELDSIRKQRYVADDAFAAIYAALGETDSAFAALDRSMAEGNLGQVIEMVEPMWRPLYKDPRWAQLLVRLKARPALMKRYR